MIKTQRDLSRNGGIREASARVATPVLAEISTQSSGKNTRWLKLCQNECSFNYEDN